MGGQDQGLETVVFEDVVEGTEELISRWVDKDRSAILYQDGYTVHEPHAWQQQGWGGAADSPTGPVLSTMREDLPEPGELFFSRKPREPETPQQPS